MKIIRTLSLSPKQTIEIHSLVSLCRRTDGIILSCPEDGDEFWLLYEDEEGGRFLAAFFAIYKMDKDTWECYAFTRPDCREHGYCSALLEKVCEDSQEEGEPDLCFITDNRCQSALDVLKHLETEFMYNEYMMALEINGAVGRSIDGESHGYWNRGIEKEISASRDSLSLDTSCDDNLPGQMTVTAWLPVTDERMTGTGELPAASFSPGSGSPAGSCRISLQGENAYLYSLEIHPSLRGQGWGTRFLHSIISMLKEQGCGRLSLQVSGTNLPALGLYEKTGFRVTETLSYYLY